MLPSTLFFLFGRAKLFSMVVAFKPDHSVSLHSKSSLKHSEDGISRDNRLYYVQIICLMLYVMITQTARIAAENESWFLLIVFLNLLMSCVYDLFSGHF